jgi:hypothetical protein
MFARFKTDVAIVVAAVILGAVCVQQLNAGAGCNTQKCVKRCKVSDRWCAGPNMGEVFVEPVVRTFCSPSPDIGNPANAKTVAVARYQTCAQDCSEDMNCTGKEGGGVVSNAFLPGQDTRCETGS